MRLAIMQGRLVPPDQGRFQSFPKERWRDEFDLAKQAGLDAIEWIYDAYGESVNPITSEPGVSALRDLQQHHGIAVPSCCADWFMDCPLIRQDEDTGRTRWRRLEWLLAQGKSLGFERIVMPFVDASAIRNAQDRTTVVTGLNALQSQIADSGVELHLETSLAPRDFAALLDEIPNPSVKVNYDIGNSASLGFDPREEINAYGARIGSVHIKDRVLGGGTVPLGEGNAQFETVFKGLRVAGYHGDFVLQVARSTSGNELEWIKANLGVVRGYLNAWFRP